MNTNQLQYENSNTENLINEIYRLQTRILVTLVMRGSTYKSKCKI